MVFMFYHYFTELLSLFRNQIVHLVTPIDRESFTNQVKKINEDKSHLIPFLIINNHANTNYNNTHVDKYW